MSGNNEHPEDFLLVFGFRRVTDSNSGGMDGLRRLCLDSVIDLVDASLAFDALRWFLGDDTTELLGVREEWPESGSVAAGCRKFGLKVDLSVAISRARMSGASMAPSLVWLWTALGKLSVRPSLLESS